MPYFSPQRQHQQQEQPNPMTTLPVTQEQPPSQSTFAGSSLFPEQRQPSPFSMTTSDGSSTLGSLGEEEGYFPSFEIQPGARNNAVVTEVAPPTAQKQLELSASVADVWVQMGQDDKREPVASSSSSAVTGASAVSQIKNPQNNIFRRTSRTVVDWWQAPCQAPRSHTILPPQQQEQSTSFWPRRSQGSSSGCPRIQDSQANLGLIPPNPSEGHRFRGDHDGVENPFHQATAKRNHPSTSSSSERRQDAALVVSNNHCDPQLGSSTHHRWRHSAQAQQQQPTRHSGQLLRVSLADSPSDRAAPRLEEAKNQKSSAVLPQRAHEHNEASAWRSHPVHTCTSASLKSNTNCGRNNNSNKATAQPSNSTTKSNKTMTDSSNASKWKTAVDPKSGKTYYYHTETRETQWRKPLELASAAEKEAMREKETQQRDFFAAMEANILRNLQAGVGVTPEPKKTKKKKKEPSRRGLAMSKNEHNLAEDELEHNSDLDSSDDEYEERRASQAGGGANQPPVLVRTISSMDERILKDLVMRVPSHRRLSSTEMSLGAFDSPTEVSDFDASEQMDKPGALPDRRVSDGSLEDMDILELAQSGSSGAGASSRPNALRGSVRQPSLGTVLATLPEENESSLNHMEFSFGEQSFADMGLSDQESQALINFAQVSSEMALMGDESFVLHDDDNDDVQGFGDVLKEGSDEDRSSDHDNHDPLQMEPEEEEVDDPFKNMSLEPTPVVSGNKKMERGVTSQRMLPSGSVVRPKVSRRNTCGTLYVGSTMSAPDVDATIKCVCGVIRAHIVQAEMDPSHRHEYLLFNDQESQQRRPSKVNEKPPSLDQVCAFYRDVFRRAQMESDCIIMSLIYVERLIKSTHGKLRPRAGNWRSVLFSSMVLASKVWDDLSMWNGDFSQTCPAGVKFTLQRINELELAVLDALSYKVKVPASEYAKYYFLLRAMLIKSGLGGDSMKELNPLDVEGARRLQAVSSKYQRAASLRMIGNTTGPRSKSLTIDIEGHSGGKGGLKNSLGGLDEDDKEQDPTLPRGKISLEHMVQM